MPSGWRRTFPATASPWSKPPGWISPAMTPWPLAPASTRGALFFTGAMPPEEKTVEQCVAQNLTPQERQQVKAFYLWGGLNYQAMGPVDKWMMGVFRKMLASQKNPSPEDKLAARMVGSSYDKTDRASLKPLEDYLTH